MLVLSRRPEEKILLPSVPAVIKVISSQAGLVRLGIEAPSHVPILREELIRGEKAADPGPASETPADVAPGPRHTARNRLHNLILGLTLLRMQLAGGDLAVRKTLQGIEEEAQALRRLLMPAAAGPPEPARATEAGV
jgi:carbon storage regulator CsrA